ncbi:hypothetical protein F5B21DRAFT_465463 [Xylaria acuta]|nr:hypothetical protein F5B21DRAFT_465463 [Xylaria acuta]
MAGRPGPTRGLGALALALALASGGSSALAWIALAVAVVTVAAAVAAAVVAAVVAAAAGVVVGLVAGFVVPDASIVVSALARDWPATGLGTHQAATICWWEAPFFRVLSPVLSFTEACGWIGVRCVLGKKEGSSVCSMQ